MCGIAGALNFNGAPADTDTLRRMTREIAHRGPDGEGLFTDGPAGLGHRRLAIIDLSDAGAQPMSNEDGSVVITYNGEIYNFRELRAELERLGHAFRSRTDSEVVVHAYEEWGASCVTRFNGMFAFALWDRRRRRMFVARDRYGIKPFYYAVTPAHFVFGSEIKAILAHGAVRASVHGPALNQYFTFQNILTDETLFGGVRILPAGTYATVDADSGAVALNSYWDFDFSRPLKMTRTEAADEIYRLFTRGVERQLVSDVPVGSYLSGGVDSGSITAVARQQLGRLATFTCGFDLSSASGLELAWDERANAEILANLLKTEHYEVVLHAGDMEQVMPALIRQLEDLRVGQCYPNYYVARLASRFVKVVLSGTGGDEVAAGYPWRYFRSSESTGRADFHQRYYNFWQRLVADEDKHALFAPAMWPQVDAAPAFDVFRQVVDRAPGSSALDTPDACVNTSLYFELKTFLHGLLVVEDRVSMAHGLETRVPFLDNDLVDFIQRVPVEYKLRALGPSERIDENETAKRRRYGLQTDEGKAILRDAMRRIIPQDVADRVKQGFSAPDASWFRGESVDYVTNLLGSPTARIYDYLQPSYIEKMLGEHTRAEKNHRLFIWSAMSFEWWLRHFIN